MLGYLVHRILIMIPTLIAISIVIFVIIHLPPGDYFSTYIAELQSQGEGANLAKIAFLKAQYGFDRPLWEQYLFWVGGLIQGDMGYSFLYDLPVNRVVGDRLPVFILVVGNDGRPGLEGARGDAIHVIGVNPALGKATILDIPRAGLVVTLNHFGMLRAFSADAIRRPGPLRRVAPLWTRTLVADVERAVVEVAAAAEGVVRRFEYVHAAQVVQHRAHLLR